MQIFSTLRRVMRKFGLDVARYDARIPIFRRMRLLQHYAIDLVLDVGANIGQFGQELREYGYRGRIVSFEPVSAAFAELARAAARDAAWDVRHEGLSDKDATADINISANSVSSSLQPMRSSHLAAAPESAYIGREQVQVRRLASIFDEIGAHGRRVMLKIDTQGAERAVLDGAAAVLDRIDLVYVETALTPLYEGDVLVDDIVPFMRARHFVPVHVEQGFFEKTSGRSFQVDIIFGRERA